MSLKNRRNFLRSIGLSSIGLIGMNRLDLRAKELKRISKYEEKPQHFNMSGYAAPKIEQVRAGFIGLGNRGPVHLGNMDKLENVEVKAVCDLRPDKAHAAKELVKNNKGDVVVYTDSGEAWKKLCEREDIDIIFIATPWELHTPVALYAMEHGKHVCVEVPAAVTLEECWQLVETSERTRKHCMMLENCCYDFFELLTLNMARQGFFGEVIHGEGAYIHNLLEGNFDKTKYWEMWRLNYNMRRKGNLYPTHGLGPVCQIMNINRGDRLTYMVSLSGKDFMMEKRAKALAKEDTFYEPYAYAGYRGNVSTSVVRTHKGKTIMIQHDVTSPNVYSRIHKIVGTKGTALKYPLPGRISNGGEDWMSEEEIRDLEKRYQPPIVKKVGDLAKQVGGHGGMDFLMDWKTIDCIRNGLPLDQDVYDAALWSCIFPLSELAVEGESGRVDIPDFTRGAWKENKPVDIYLEEGGNTRINL